MKRLPLFGHTGREDRKRMPESEERKRIKLLERARRKTDGGKIDFSQGDSSADDHASYVVLHKHLATAEGG